MWPGLCCVSPSAAPVSSDSVNTKQTHSLSLTERERLEGKLDILFLGSSEPEQSM